MSREGLIADRYARALFNLTLKGDSLEDVYQEFSVFHDYALNARELFQFVGTPTVPLSEKEAFIEKVFGQKFSKLFIEFLKTLIRKKRFLNVNEIYLAFDRCYKTHKQIKNVEVITAKNISDKASSALHAILEKKLDSKINIENKVDSKMVGGIIIRFEGKEIDGSFRSRIKEVRNLLLQQ